MTLCLKQLRKLMELWYKSTVKAVQFISLLLCETWKRENRKIKSITCVGAICIQLVVMVTCFGVWFTWVQVVTGSRFERVTRSPALLIEERGQLGGRHFCCLCEGRQRVMQITRPSVSSLATQAFGVGHRTQTEAGWNYRVAGCYEWQLAGYSVSVRCGGSAPLKAEAELAIRLKLIQERYYCTVFTL